MRRCALHYYYMLHIQLGTFAKIPRSLPPGFWTCQRYNGKTADNGAGLRPQPWQACFDLHNEQVLQMSALQAHFRDGLSAMPVALCLA